MGVKPEDIERAIRSGNKVLEQLKQLCPSPPDDKSSEVLSAASISQPKRRRIKQDHKPMLNQLETAWLEKLKQDFPRETFRFQDRRYKLANGVWYKPDITCAQHEWPEELDRDVRWRETCWECKGNKGKNIDRGIVMLKVAAACWPEVRWVLVWRNDEGWNEQEVLP